MEKNQKVEQHRILARDVAREITLDEANEVAGGLMMQTGTAVGHRDGSPTTYDSSNND